MSLQTGCYTITIKKLYYSKFPYVAQLFVFHIVCYNRFVLTNLMEAKLPKNVLFSLLLIFANKERKKTYICRKDS